jgi:hypothetical protein
MMDRMEAPERAAVKNPMGPVQQEVRRHHVDGDLDPERQAGQRSAAVLEIIDDVLCCHDAGEERGARDHQAHAQIGRDEWYDDKIAEIGEEARIAPPGTARIAGFAGEQA